MKTTAAVLEKTGEPLSLGSLDVPALGAGQVLVRVRYSGICRTQVNEWLGRKGPDRYLPHTLGHEGAGEVIDVGPKVSKVKVGDRVVVTWLKGSGADVPSCTYQRDAGVVNSGAVSTFLEKAVVSENRLVPVGDMPEDFASLLGCAVPTGCGMVFNQLKPRAGDSMAVWGAGGIGLCAVLAAVACGCDPVIAVDVNDHKLDLARSCGATHALNGREDPVAAIMDLTDNQGVDCGIESAGLIETMESGFSAVRRGGGRFLIAGNAAHGERMRLDPFDLIAGKKIFGSWGGATHPDRDIPRYVDMWRSGKLKLERLITHRLSLDRINDALNLVEQGEAGRVLLDMRTCIAETAGGGACGGI